MFLEACFHQSGPIRDIVNNFDILYFIEFKVLILKIEKHDSKKEEEKDIMISME